MRESEERSSAEMVALVQGAIRPFLEAQAAEPLSTEASLRDLGLTSIRAVEMVLELEALFGITFPDDQLNQAAFGSIARLARTIQLLRDANGT